MHVRPTLLLLLATVTTSSAVPPLSRDTTLHLRDRDPVTDPAQTVPLADLAVALLESSNFNTAAHPDTLKQSLPDIHHAYRRAAAGDHLVVTFDRPVPTQTVGGPTDVLQIVVAIGPEYANALFTLHPDGHLIAHSKFAGHLALQLRQAITRLPQPPNN